jgi:CheY-like chemotaxis protein
MSAQRKVLVVDDDPVVGESFNRVLSRKGYAVITASNGDEALAKLQAEQYDLVFTDLRMPGMDGLEVAERVKARQPWTPVVIVTGYGSKPSEDRARAVGVAEFLHKPLSPEMIEDSAAKALAPAPIAAVQPAVAADAAAAEVAPAKKPNVLKNMVLFLLAPFVGLAYAVLLPFVGIGMIAYVALKKDDGAVTPKQAE